MIKTVRCLESFRDQRQMSEETWDRVLGDIFAALDRFVVVTEQKPTFSRLGSQGVSIVRVLRLGRLLCHVRPSRSPQERRYLVMPSVFGIADRIPPEGLWMRRVGTLVKQ